MQTRHRIPTIFSVYMVDVLCCALGCVILLWLINFREAKNRASAASESNQRLSETRASLSTTSSEAANLRAAVADSRLQAKNLLAQLGETDKERNRYQNLLQQAKTEHEQTRKDLKLTEAQLAGLRLDLKDLLEKNSLTASALAARTKETADLSKKIAAAQVLILSLEKDVTAKSAQNTMANARIEDLINRLRDSDARVLVLGKQVAGLQVDEKKVRSRLEVSDIRALLLERDLEKYKKELAIAQNRYQDLLLTQDTLSKRLTASAKNLGEARSLISSLQGERATLLSKAQAIEAAVKNRFAGITLTGQRVLFLVDMSGSMELTDEATLDPDKWPLVAATVGRLLASLPELQKYQVILFSDKVRYPLGNPGRWLDYEPGKSLKTTAEAIKNIKPAGETNMAAAFEEAFRFRDEGMDTIYVLSDGLPNAGEGLPAGAANLSQVKKGEHLGRYVRQRLNNVLNRSIPGRPRVRINTIGFFFESPDLGAFLWALARENDGSFVGMSGR
jgi:hypothetical protein